MTQSTADYTTEMPNLATLPERERHELLTNERRRVAFSVLADRTTPIELPDLAAKVAAREDCVDAADPDAVETVEVELHHVHLPKLAALDVVDYSPASQIVTP